MHGGEYAPLQPPEIRLSSVACGGLLEAFFSMRGEEGKERVQEVKGLARDGTRLPSGARPTQPNQTVQVAGGTRAI